MAEVTVTQSKKRLLTDHSAQSATLTTLADQEERHVARPMKTRQANAVPDSTPNRSPPFIRVARAFKKESNKHVRFLKQARREQRERDTQLSLLLR